MFLPDDALPTSDLTSASSLKNIAQSTSFVHFSNSLGFLATSSFGRDPFTIPLKHMTFRAIYTEPSFPCRISFRLLDIEILSIEIFWRQGHTNWWDNVSDVRAHKLLAHFVDLSSRHSRNLLEFNIGDTKGCNNWWWCLQFPGTKSEQQPHYGKS